MIESDRIHFNSALDRLADRIHSLPLSDSAKGDYWEVLKHLEAARFLKVVEQLISSYKPRWMSDFPVLKDFSSAIQSLPLPEHLIFHSHPCRCCSVTPHANGQLACQCDLERCFGCFHCGKCCKCAGGLIPLEEMPEWKAAKEKLCGVAEK